MGRGDVEVAKGSVELAVPLACARFSLSAGSLSGKLHTYKHSKRASLLPPTSSKKGDCKVESVTGECTSRKGKRKRARERRGKGRRKEREPPPPPGRILLQPLAHALSKASPNSAHVGGNQSKTVLGWHAPAAACARRCLQAMSMSVCWRNHASSRAFFAHWGASDP